MSRFTRSKRRPDHWASAHDRARARAAERLGGDLEPSEAAWLDAHLAECPSCAAIATTYDADRLALRALRDLPAQPPRDLWARTAAAIERESATHQRPQARVRPSRSRLPLGALSGIAVIALVVGVSTLSRTMIQQPSSPEREPDQRSTTGGDGNSEFVGAGPTPFAVGAGEVEYVLRDHDGLLAMNNVPVDAVCPAEGTAGCPDLRDASAQHLELVQSPRTIIQSPRDRNAIVVAKGAGGGDQILVLALPAAAATASPEPPATPPPPATLNPAGATRPPLASAEPSPSQPSAASSPSVASPVVPSDVVESAPPNGSPPVDTGASPALLPTAEPTPTLSPEPTVARSLALANDIEVVGDSAAFSADGAWFAFTARPADRSAGPDVYVWRVGDPAARNLTEDGETLFASWDGDQVVASRPYAPSVSTGPTESTGSPVTVRIDPATGLETAAGHLWLPAVDPTSRRAIAWNGTIQRASDGTTWKVQDGQLELRPWSAEGGGQVPGGQAADDDHIVTDKVGTFDIRWDETGEWVAVWIADANDPDVGRLSLYRVDPQTGRLDRLDDAPDGVAALPGFSISDGRLAWASPPGQEGEGSRIQIVAWSGKGVGSVESAPGEDLVLIR